MEKKGISTSRDEDLWHRFALRKGFELKHSKGAEAVQRISGKVFRQDWSGNPAAVAPPAGAVVVAGRSNGLKVEMDTVVVKNVWLFTQTVYTRASMELSDAPSDLVVASPHRISLLSRILSHYIMKTGNEVFDTEFAVMSSTPDAVGKYLTRERQLLLLDARAEGDVQIHNQKVYLIRRGRVETMEEAEDLFTNIETLGRRMQRGLQEG
ncbi:MAG: hypothetical protein ACLFQR_09315 [Desulfovibrionales bacterium]